MTVPYVPVWGRRGTALYEGASRMLGTPRRLLLEPGPRRRSAGAGEAGNEAVHLWRRVPVVGFWAGSHDSTGGIRLNRRAEARPHRAMHEHGQWSQEGH